MAYSHIVIPGDGVTTLLAVNFALGYINTADVTCRVGNEVDGSGNPVYRTITWVTPSTAQVSGLPAAVGVNYVFDRAVTKTALIVDWDDGEAITETNLNTAQKQAIMMAHEALDGVARAVKVPQGSLGYDIAGGIGVGNTLMVGASNTLVAGPNAADIVAAQSYATLAAAAATLAAGSQTAAAGSATSAANSAILAATNAASVLLGVQNRAALKVVNTALQTFGTIVNEGGRNGPFVWTLGDFSTHIAADVGEAMYVKSTATAATVGVWVRQNVGRLNPLWAGATTNGVDSLTAMNNLISLAVFEKRAIELPVGFITCSGPLTKNLGSTQFAMRGQGAGISGIIFSGGSGGISLTYTNVSGFTQISNPVILTDFSVLTSQFLGGTAVGVIVSPTIASSVSPGAMVERLIVRGTDVTTKTWTDGIVLLDGWNSFVNACYVKGLDDATAPFDMQSGIAFTRCNDCHAIQNHIYHVQYGINTSSNLTSYGDGILIHDNRIVGVAYGILASGSSGGNEFVGITYNHINAYYGGIQMSNLGFTPIVGNLIFKTNLSTQNDWFGILATGTAGCNQNRFSLNQISLPGAPVTASNWGIWLQLGSSDNQVIGNIFNIAGAGQHFTGVYLESSANKNQITDNHCDASVSTPISIAGSAGNTNFIYGNWPHMAPQLFPANATTPSVGNLIDGQAATANTSATTITNFNDALEGQEWTILINDNFTTIQNNAGMLLKGGVNITGAPGGQVRFKRLLGATREHSRSF